MLSKLKTVKLGQIMHFNDRRNMDEYEDDDSANSGKSMSSIGSMFSGFQSKKYSSEKSEQNQDDAPISKE